MPMNQMMQGPSIPARDPRLQPDMNLSDEEIMRAADALLPIIGEALTGYGIDDQIPNIAQNLARQLVSGQGPKALPTGNMSRGRMASMGPSARMAQRGYNAP